MKQYAVLGLGDFGMAVARYLCEHGSQVIAIDSEEERVRDISDVATMAICADSEDIDTIKSFDLGKLDGVIVSCGPELGPNIMGIVAAKESNVPYILAKAGDERTASLYRTIGATEVVFPEKEMGKRVARSILNDRYVDLVELDEESVLGEMIVPEKWLGKSLVDLNVRNKCGINVIAFKENDKLIFNFDPHRKFRNGDVIMVVGKDEDLIKIR